MLLTEGRMERDGRSAAEKQAVEVLDGPRLWPLLQPYLPAEIETRVRASARHEALRRIAIAALGAVTLGLLVGLSLQGLHVQDTPPVAEVADTPRRLRLRLKRRPNRRRPRHHAAGRCACTGHALSRRAQQPQPGCRHAGAFPADLSRALAGKPGIASGVWLTRQTLAINRTGELDAVWPQVCEEVLHYPALRNVRIQLNARPGVDEPVRWRQCATY